MISLLVGVLVLSWLVGRTKGLLGGLAGGFVGALVAAGMATTTSSGDLAALYSPAQLASAAVPVAIVAAVLVLVAPYAVGFAALGWAVGALLAALTAVRAGQVLYALPLTVHVLTAGLVVWLASQRHCHRPWP
jgi:hypothetical protein